MAVSVLGRSRRAKCASCVLFKRAHMRNRNAWNKGRLLGQKPPLKPKEIWSIRIRLRLANRGRDLALFNLALDSKLRGCDLTSLRVRTSSWEAPSLVVPSSCSGRRSGQCNSRSLRPPARRWPHGFLVGSSAPATTYFRAEKPARTLASQVRSNREELDCERGVGSGPLRNAFT